MSQNRALALDALRGVAILAMLLSGQLPFGGNSLPAWMYHAQSPPPAHQWIGTLPGITWVDLVFPVFLFSLGASIPLALSRRMDRCDSVWRCGLGIVERGFLLGFFALFVQAIRPYTLSSHPTAAVWLRALAGFLLLFPILSRLPPGWSLPLRLLIRIGGWLGAALFLALATYPDGSGFKLTRSDIIIVVLANMSVFGAVVWMLTRRQWLPRAGVLGILLAVRVSNMPQPVEGWVHDLWKFSPAPWIYQLYYLQYLCIVIPGTFAGDLLLDWLQGPAPSTVVAEGARKSFATALVMFSFVPLLLWGLQTRCLLPVTLLCLLLCGVGLWLLSRPSNPAELLHRRLFLWALYWLVLGLFFEPYEGGIKKDRATVSYYFVTSGLALCLLIGFSIVVSACRKARWLGLLIENGQNPMIAYAGINNFITPLLGLTGVNTVLAQWATTPWLGFWRALMVTLLMAATVGYLTRRRVFWRT